MGKKTAQNNTWIWLIGGALVAALILYWTYIPLPSGLAERHRMQIFEFVMRMCYFYPVKLMSMLGGSVEEHWHWQLHWTRNTMGFLSRVVGPWPHVDYELTISNADFDGVPVRIYRPIGERHNDGAIVFIHGGGFVTLDTTVYEGVTRHLARDSGMVVISVDYRLAPEHIFPAGIEDCEKVVVHLLQKRHKELGVDPSRVAVMGDSAGGNLAAVVAQRLRSRTDLPSLKLQVLIYPVLQYVDFLTPSYQTYYREYEGTAFLDPESIARWLMLYVGVKPERHMVEHVLANNHTTAAVRQSAPLLKYLSHDRLPSSYKINSVVPDHPQGNDAIYSQLEPFIFNPDFSPLMQPDLTGLPSTMVLTCEYDILRDEGFWYAERLKEANVEVEYKHVKGGFHAMLMFANEVDLARQIITDMAAYVQKNI